jgi:hypothetical protein
MCRVGWALSAPSLRSTVDRVDHENNWETTIPPPASIMSSSSSLVGVLNVPKSCTSHPAKSGGSYAQAEGKKRKKRSNLQGNNKAPDNNPFENVLTRGHTPPRWLAREIFGALIPNSLSYIWYGDSCTQYPAFMEARIPMYMYNVRR